MTAGMSRNFNIYTPEELRAFSCKLMNAPVYIEHVAVPTIIPASRSFAKKSACWLVMA
jgi:hypothetical protein